MTYRIFEAIFEQNGALISAAEAHGIATGMLCLDNRVESMTWIEESFEEVNSINNEDKSELFSLFDQTRELLESTDFEFALLLPEDDFPLSEQAEALQQWCEGFLFGVGFVNSTTDWSGESSEILQDIVEISKMDTAVEGEEDENALVEIYEYLKMGVLLIREELHHSIESAQLH
jgi:uncharacterized protein